MFRLEGTRSGARIAQSRQFNCNCSVCKRSHIPQVTDPLKQLILIGRIGSQAQALCARLEGKTDVLALIE